MAQYGRLCERAKKVKHKSRSFLFDKRINELIPHSGQLTEIPHTALYDNIFILSVCLNVCLSGPSGQINFVCAGQYKYYEGDIYVLNWLRKKYMIKLKLFKYLFCQKKNVFLAVISNVSTVKKEKLKNICGPK